jgi:hypothetical protein
MCVRNLSSSRRWLKDTVILFLNGKELAGEFGPSGEFGSSTGPAGGESGLDGISTLESDVEFGSIPSSSCLSSIA